MLLPALAVCYVITWYLFQWASRYGKKRTSWVESDCSGGRANGASNVAGPLHAMSRPGQIPVYRYSTRYLNDVIQCTEPMTDELAQRIRALHRDYRLDYETVPAHLCTGDTTGPEAFAAGKMLVELAAFHLHEDYRRWRPS